VVYDDETDRIMADMDTPGETRLLLKGGKGGWGNQHFATPTRQAPNFAKPGMKTEIRTLRLELKTIADVGLIGYPNVGKSSILSVVTSARPKVGNYHFTTLTPNLGIVRRFGKDIVLADIPGLIEGAAEGAGLGHDFLRHVERTRLLLHVLDVSGSEGRDPVEDLRQINTELENYGELGSRPQIIVCNKTDLTGAAENLERVREAADELGCKVFAVSAATHEGFDELLDETARQLDELPPILHYEEEEEPEPEEDLDAFEVSYEDGVYIVTGKGMERLVDSVNFNDQESLSWFHRSLKRLGVIDKLREAGAEEGSAVQIGEMEFDFVE
jgi:GTP-binding protein